MDQITVVRKTNLILETRLPCRLGSITLNAGTASRRFWSALITQFRLATHGLLFQAVSLAECFVRPDHLPEGDG